MVVLLINSTLTTTSTNKIITNKTVKKKILNKTKKGEFQPMFELAKQLIDKECKIYAVGFASSIKGVIKEVTDDKSYKNANLAKLCHGNGNEE